MHSLPLTKHTKKEGGALLVLRKNTVVILAIIILVIISIIIFFQFTPILGKIFSVIFRLLIPFIIAALISYLLHPVSEKLQQWKISKGIAILIIYLIFFGSISILVIKGYPLLVHELQDLNAQLPQFVNIYEQLIFSLYESTSFLPEMAHDHLDELIVNFELRAEASIERFLNKFVNILDYIIIVTMIPVLVFYFLKDYEHIITYLQRCFPMRYRNQFNQLLYAIHDGLGSYIRGQILVSGVIFLLSFLIFHVVQLKYAFVLSIIMGLTNIIPYFGPIIGTIPAAAIAVTTSWKLLLVVLVTTVIIQVLEGSFLSPYIMGKNVNIHPIIIIFVLLAGSELAGVIGMLVAIPTVTILKSIIVQFRSSARNAIDI